MYSGLIGTYSPSSAGGLDPMSYRLHKKLSKIAGGSGAWTVGPNDSMNTGPVQLAKNS
jgi:hypothetical protein